jgi:GMP synthase PP-ATPase subunit
MDCIKFVKERIAEIRQRILFPGPALAARIVGEVKPKPPATVEYV